MFISIPATLNFGFEIILAAFAKFSGSFQNI